MYNFILSLIIIDIINNKLSNHCDIQLFNESILSI